MKNLFFRGPHEVKVEDLLDQILEIAHHSSGDYVIIVERFTCRIEQQQHAVKTMGLSSGVTVCNRI
jgi:hypothetical protein